MPDEINKNVPASYLALIEDNKILLLKRCNTGYRDGEYSLPAGHVEENENFTQCIIREAEEEIGVKLEPEEINVAHIMHRKNKQDKNNQRIDVFFTAENWDGEIRNKEPEKCSDLSWYPLEDLPDNTIPYVEKAIEKILNDEHYSEHGWQKY